MTRVFPVDDSSRVAQVRREAAAMSEAEGLEAAQAANLAVVTTEICTNLLKHAKGAEVFLSTLSNRAQPGVEVLAIDRGPGMVDVARCLTDGYSSASTAGTGLGAVIRLSSEFDINSVAAKGTVLVARVNRRSATGGRESRSPTWIGVVQKAVAGEEVCGDSWAVCVGEQAMSFILADGLGHGPLAAQASMEAITTFRRFADDPPICVLQRVHETLQRTRGAAVSVAFIERQSSTVRYAGVGNVVGALVKTGRPVLMVSHNGTAGYQSPRLQEFSYPLGENALLVMHSDGLQSNWDLDRYPGLQRCDPSIIAGVLYRDFGRTRDDNCVLVVRTGGSL